MTQERPPERAANERGVLTSHQRRRQAMTVTVGAAGWLATGLACLALSAAAILGWVDYRRATAAVSGLVLGVLLLYMGVRWFLLNLPDLRSGECVVVRGELHIEKVQVLSGRMGRFSHHLWLHVDGRRFYRRRLSGELRDGGRYRVICTRRVGRIVAIEPIEMEAGARDEAG